ncbi:PadR family transcriptional regulator [Rugosimonospora acidiphila]|uniref:PadR family transcriptional regulator n=1 Tax=Rugosimonospora acidiphila TaxID=556531 RepID=UPI0031EBC100
MDGGRPANPLALAVLGLLLERPMHPHAMATTLRERGLDQAFKVTTGSLYDVVRSLERANWISAQETARVGGRPARTVYAHTARGRDEFVAWLDELIRVPAKEYPKFISAISYLGALGRQPARDALTERARCLSAQAEQARAVWREVVDSGRAPRLFMLEAEYGLRMIEAELTWVGQLIADIDEGRLSWPAAGARPAHDSGRTA